MDLQTLALIAGGGAVIALTVVFAVVLQQAFKTNDALRSALDEARQTLSESDRARAEAETRALRVDELKAELSSERSMRDEAERKIAGLTAQMREREVSVDEERKRLTALSQEMQDRFKALAGEALDVSTKKLMEQAQATFKVQAEKAEGGVKTLVDPIRERLELFRQQVEAVEKERVTHRSEMGEQIRQLSEGLNRQHGETAKLVNALQRKSTTRGQWGERTVENILELAGLTKNIDYDAQYQTRNSEGDALRPDFVVNLPGGGRFVIDSKVALTAYLDAVEAPDDASRADALRRHAAQVRTHVRQLSKKEYAQAVEGAIDFVALFIPGESFYSAAIEQDPTLFDEAIKADVIITTPATLLALAKAVAYGFRQEKLEHNAQKIASLGAELHDRLSTFAEHLGRVGSGLRTATGNYNKAVASLEGRVMVSARRMAELNGQTKALEAPAQVDETPRALTAPDED